MLIDDILVVFCFRKNALIENNPKKINPPKDDDENEELAGERPWQYTSTG